MPALKSVQSEEQELKYTTKLLDKLSGNEQQRTGIQVSRVEEIITST